MAKCIVCGREVERCMYFGPICSDECFSRRFWDMMIENKEDYIVVNGTAYFLGDENAIGFRGFGGRKFTFRNLKTGTISFSTNLWYRGDIPKALRDFLPNTHEFVET